MDKVYYIKGSKENPEGVKQVLLKVCPDAENIDDFSFDIESYYYYVINGIIDYACDLPHILLLKHAGIELQPKIKIIEEEPVQFRLPTKEEFEYLLKHFPKWNGEKKSREFLSRVGGTLKLPVTGYYLNGLIDDADTHGYYWSSTKDEYNSDFAYNLYFNSISRSIIISNCSRYKYAVRLVSNTPFKGAVEFNGVYWKPENEPGYYTFDEALEKFDNKK